MPRRILGTASRILQRNFEKPPRIQDFEPTAVSCVGLEYLELPTPIDTRYPHEHQPLASLLVDNTSQSSSVFGGFPAPLLNTSAGYHSDVSSFYTPNTHIYSNLEPRNRHSGLDNSTSSTPMNHVHRTTVLPNLPYSTRDLYSRAVPSYPGRIDHVSRSASTTTPLRRHPLSPTPSPSMSFTSPSSRMETTPFSTGQPTSVPPLLPLSMNGRLCYADTASTPLNLDIQGAIDKGFFYSEGDWTCYRRNYFACVCAYNYSPMLQTAIQFTPAGSSQTYTVFGFAMSISAVVAESDSQQIDLVQHTPKRDKGPVSKPEKVRLEPKPAPALGLYGTDPHARMFEGGYIANNRGNFPTDHTFERIQFKQATANNGKRRAAQQYYHLVIELYGDVGNQSADPFIKVAQRKSAKMIVRGRSPGHYQQDRRGSTGSGGGSASGMGGFGGHQMLGSEYGSGPTSLLPSTYGSGGYDPRPSGHFSSTRHSEIHRDTALTDDSKLIPEPKDYQYFPGAIYEGATDSTQHRVEMFTHRNDHADHMVSSRHPGNGDGLRVKHEYDGHPSTLYNPGAAYYPGNCQRFEGRSSSSGYYPTISPQSG
ncbi:meiosis-specific transcription factor NDT80 [Microdochium nivale]|nr:meiosis-specific transcription factor NDT80 [Microdochium nivale]